MPEDDTPAASHANSRTAGELSEDDGDDDPDLASGSQLLLPREHTVTEDSDYGVQHRSHVKGLQRRLSASSMTSWLRSKLTLSGAPSHGPSPSLVLVPGLGTLSTDGPLSALRTILTSSWFNLLLVFVPLGIVAQLAHVAPFAVFALNALAIIPLTGLLTYATENVAQTLGVGLGALLNITFGNMVELIILIFMIREGHLQLVLASLLGSIFVNLLFILGVAMWLGGLRNHEQLYDQRLTQMQLSFMNLGIFSILIPTSLHACVKGAKLADQITLEFSRGTALTLLVVYGLYLHFMLKSRFSLYEEVDSRSVSDDGEAQHWPTNPNAVESVPVPMEMQEVGGRVRHSRVISEARAVFISPPGDACPEKQISRRASLALLLVSAATVSVCAEFLVDSIEHVVAHTRLTEAFLGLIILPLLGNTAEMATAITVALKNKVDLAINVTVGSAIQITLFMAPAMVTLSWCMGKGLAMHFNMFQIITLLVTLAMVNAMMLNGRSHYLVGALLCFCYVVIAIGAFVFPNQTHKYEA